MKSSNPASAISRPGRKGAPGTAYGTRRRLSEVRGLGIGSGRSGASSGRWAISLVRPGITMSRRGNRNTHRSLTSQTVMSQPCPSRLNERSSRSGLCLDQAPRKGFINRDLGSPLAHAAMVSMAPRLYAVVRQANASWSSPPARETSQGCPSVRGMSLGRADQSGSAGCVGTPLCRHIGPWPPLRSTRVASWCEGSAVSRSLLSSQRGAAARVRHQRRHSP